MKSLSRRGALSAALLLAACLGGEEGDDGSPGTSTSGTSTYESRILDIDRESETLTTLETYWYCDGEEAVHDSDIFEERYQIEDGDLYRWEDNYGCMATILSGSSDDLVGTWTGKPPAYGEPPGGDDAGCDGLAYSDRKYLSAAVRRTTVVEKITETSIKGTLTGEVCWAELHGWILTTNSGNDDEDIVPSQKGCSSVKLTREEDGVTARLEIEHTASGLKAKFTTGGESCSATLSLGEEDEPVCTDGGGDALFEECVYATGFFGDDAYYKAGAFAAKKHRALRALRGGF